MLFPVWANGSSDRAWLDRVASVAVYVHSNRGICSHSQRLLGRAFRTLDQSDIAESPKSADTVEKSVCITEYKFSEPQARRSSNHLRDYIILS